MLAALALAWWTATAVPSHATILMYHHVADDTPASTSLSPSVFSAQLRWLSENDYTVMPLMAVVDSLRHRRPLPDRTVVFTFDDGYASVYHEAFPRLRARGWPFTVFVCPSDIDARRGPVTTWDQLREMAAAGADVGNHGLNHGHLQRRRPGEDDAAWRTRLRADLLTAQDRIGREIGTAPTLLAYPFGEFDLDLRALVIEQGWTGCGQHSGPVGEMSDLAALPRFAMAGPWGAMAMFKEKMDALPFPVARIAPRDPCLPLVPGVDELRPVLRMGLEPTATGWAGIGAFADTSRAEVSWSDDGAPTLLVRSRQSLTPGRHRYNVTAPSPWPGRWYWYSHMWIVGRDHEN